MYYIGVGKINILLFAFAMQLFTTTHPDHPLKISSRCAFGTGSKSVFRPFKKEQKEDAFVQKIHCFSSSGMLCLRKYAK
jgi:hypothetical protein